jgi:hypothetical protein
MNRYCFPIGVLACSLMPGMFVPSVAAAAQAGDHCLRTNLPLWKVCPMPPQDVAFRGNPSELRSWGIPEKPDRNLLFADYKDWFHKFFQMKRTVTTHLSLGRAHPALPGLQGVRPPTGTGVVQNPNWSGWILAAAPGQASQLVSIKASFIAPLDGIPGQTSPICPGIVVAHAGHWVGIDGLNGLTGSTNGNVIQTGLDNYLACSGAGATGIEVLTPWVEYYPRDPTEVDVPFSQGPVYYGDKITLQIDWDYNGSGVQTAYLYITDKRLDAMIALSTPLDDAPVVPFNPNEAEVITEAPGGAPGGGRWLMPDWGTVIFKNSVAKDSSGNFDWLGSAVVSNGTTIFNSDGLDFTIAGVDGGEHVFKTIKDVGSKYKGP